MCPAYRGERRYLRLEQLTGTLSRALCAGGRRRIFFFERSSMAELKLREEDGREAVFPLDPETPLTIGRSEKADVTLPRSKVSSFHAQVSFHDGSWLIEDQQSTNGTYVNDRKITRMVLSAGDTISIGPFSLLFSADREEAGEKTVAEKDLGKIEFDVAGMNQQALLEAAERLKQASESIAAEMSRVIVGQKQTIADLLLALFARGHVLLVGVPGLAKTLMVSTLAGILDLSFKRVQFTPDLMPFDITGTEILEEDPGGHSRSYKFLKGPVFTNILLADEINRTPPKTQAALLEAMQEYRVTAAGSTHELPLPFFVLATQNPIEQEGTYPLPEAQLDRFMFNCIVDYPERAEEVDILRTTTVDELARPQRILEAEEILACQQLVRALPVSDYVFLYAADLARATRPKSREAPDFVNRYVAWGAGPRAAQYLVLGAKARALLEGRLNVSLADVRSVAHVVFRHRIFLNFHADSDGLTVDAMVDRLLKHVPEPQADDLKTVEKGAGAAD